MRSVPPAAPERLTRPLGPWIGLGIALAVLATYAPVARYGFVNFDDPEYVIENVHVHGGLTRAGLAWAFGAFHAANWHPLTWLSHMLDWQLFGPEPGGHHVTNVVLHAAAAVFLFLALHRMTGAPWRSGVVAALFALHPLRVESVAWISERKDVLSACFWMAAMLAYARYAERPTWPRYAAVLLAFVAGLLAKPMVVTLPFALLLLDLWPLGRLSLKPGSGRQWRGPVLEKLPFLGLAAAVSVVTFLAQSRGGAVTPLSADALPGRVLNALLSYVAYLGMTVWPRGLAIFYPSPTAISVWEVAGAVLVLGAVTALAILRVRHAPWLLVGWLWYLGTLAPVVGIVRAGAQGMADRFTYIPHVGLLVAAVWEIASLAAAWRVHRLALPVAAVVGVATCVLTTRVQLGYWQDSLGLFGHALAVTERNGVAHTNYGFALLEHGQAEEALVHFREAVTLEPRHVKARMNLGFGLATLGRSEEAIVEYHEAIRLNPSYAPTHYNLGLELAERGQVEDAIAEYREALRLDPAHTGAHNNLGLALARQGQVAEGLAQYEAALALDPGLVAAHNNAAVALERLGRNAEALAHYREAVRLEPGEARAHFNLGAVLDGRGRLTEAAAEYREVLRLAGDLVEANLALGDVLARQGQSAEALAQYRIALAARPDWPAAQTRMAWALATRAEPEGDPAEAVRLAERAREGTEGGDAGVLRSLAAAYAAAGRFREAGDVARRAAVLAREAGMESLAAEVEGHAATYAAGRPLRNRPGP